MVTLQNNGEIRTYASHSLREFQGRIFSPRFKDNFQSVVRQASIESSYPNSGIQIYILFQIYIFLQGIIHG